jgi:hypothetical protein
VSRIDRDIAVAERQLTATRTGARRLSCDMTGALGVIALAMSIIAALF